MQAKLGRVHLEAGKKVAIKVDYSLVGGDPKLAQLIWSKYDPKPAPEAVEAAKNADVVIAVLGITGEDWQDHEIVGLLRKKQPNIIINDRTNAPADFRSREGDGALGKFDNQTPWELCTTIVEGAWGYQKGATVKPLDHIIRLLVGAAGRDGNFLLNVGPRPDGEIDPSQLGRLHEIGDWLKQNGESVYGTRGGPWLPGDYGASTYRGTNVYLHILKDPENRTLELPNLPIRIVKVTNMKGDLVSYNQNETYTRIKVPISATAAIDVILKVELAQPWSTSAVVPVESDKGLFH